MLEPLIWMFKINNFYKHYLILFFISILTPLMFLYTPYSILENVNGFCKLPTGTISIIYLIILILPLLAILGYFWNLADNIANREDDIIASSIYDGKILINKYFLLPNINVLKLIWRGITSIIALMILILPIAFVLFNILYGFESVSEFWGWNSITSGTFIYFLLLFLISFLPALLWNYAQKDTVTAIWNFPLAVYIMGNYTKKYIINIIYYCIISLCIYFSAKFAVSMLNIESINNLNSVNKFSFISLYVIYSVAGIYFLFVSAYLIGTIAPPSES